MRSSRVICIAALALATGGSAAAADLHAGGSSARAKGPSVKLDVDSAGAVSLTYAMKTKCGRSKGKIALSKSGSGLRGRRVSRGPQSAVRTTVAKVMLSGDRTEGVGVLKESLRGGANGVAGCEAQRIFSASFPQGQGVVSVDDGRYTGTGPDGLPISFDVVTGERSTRVENLTVKVPAECLAAGAPYLELIDKAVRVTGIAGRVDPDHSFYIELAPDEDTWYEFAGQLRGGRAEVEVTVSGNFDAHGDPNPAGPFACDSWGDFYDARRK